MAAVEAIATTYLEADVASVTFSSIPATYEHLEVRMSMMGDRTASDAWYLYLRLNGDTGTNYQNHQMYVTGVGTTTAVGARYTGQDTHWTPDLPTLGGGATYYGSEVIDIFDYANTNKNTTFLIRSAIGSRHGTSYTGAFSGMWDDTAAVDEIWLAPDNVGTDDSIWQRGSSFTLYGWNSS